MFKSLHFAKMVPPLLALVLTFSCESQKSLDTVSDNGVVPFSVEELQKRTFDYFWNLADSTNYQIPDRYPKKTFTSIAATGFGLSSYLVGIERGYVSRKEAAERVLNTLRLMYDLPQGPAEKNRSGYKGFFYHFLTYENATRYKNVELSSIDTGLLMAGILSTQSYFDKENTVESEIRKLADNLYRRVEWDWMLTDKGTICMGWKPESGKLPFGYEGYSEAMILYILSLGSPTHAIPEDSWNSWTSTYSWDLFEGQELVNYSPLFTHQYAHMYIDFKGIQDEYMSAKGMDYFENSKRATYTNRSYCISNPDAYKGYGKDCWGLTACDGPGYRVIGINGQPRTFEGYMARGASAVHVRDDGTIAPTAAGGSVPFAPEICLPALENMWNTYYTHLVGEYGFKDAFNLTFKANESDTLGWFDEDYLGIDQGPILIQIQNHQTGLIWKIMKKNPYVIAGLKKAGFEGGWLDDIE
jgi:hypothetical protein